MRKMAYLIGLVCFIFSGVSFASPSIIQNFASPAAASCTVASTTGICGFLEQQIQVSCYNNTHNAAECQFCSASPLGIALQVYDTAPGGASNWEQTIYNYCKANGGTNAAECYTVFTTLLVTDKCMNFTA